MPHLQSLDEVVVADLEASKHLCVQLGVHVDFGRLKRLYIGHKVMQPGSRQWRLKDVNTNVA